ncbi:AraC family transcriptional regulator [Saccharothrix violaceirubra]|uniref:AraC-like DNA-binding protein n=1 Tax=Saccharothrix violaceirubra TaxID=413306 RepID=A0A7W7WXL6_9PSEU|nr:AraC family transcriptional regulator [Saccharothrix violaceirubra]MBB4967579.1 AraC-like DNA-binding protein [Saccharothrix violaceirubra]
MDALTDLLRGVHARSALLCRSFVTEPWAMAYTPTVKLTVTFVLDGDAWLLVENMAPLRVTAGSVGLVRGRTRFVLASDPSTPPQFDAHQDDCERWRIGTRTYGLAPEGDATVITGSYDVQDVSDRLLNALPPALVVGCDPCATSTLLSEEVAVDRPGQDIVLDRLLDLLLVFALREWFEGDSSNAPGWYHALGDDVVGPALRAVHGRPDRAWTVSELAAEAGVSRALFARRFSALVGVPPLTYLTGLRMDVAADLLAEPGATVTSVARAVGYADGFAFSTAFKRVRGVRPSVVALRA